MTIATTETFYNTSNEKKSNTQWHNVVLWNNMTELHKIISKGDLIFVEGKLNYRKKSVTEIFTEIIAKNIRVLHKKSYIPKNTSDSQIEDKYVTALDSKMDLDEDNYGLFED